MKKRAVLYARVSTADQADKGYSVPSQFEAMRKYAAQFGFEVVAEFWDDYSGATPIEFRPEGRKAYAMLQSDQADVVIAYTIDRFVRPPEDGDEWDMPILIRGLAKLGKEIHTVRRGKLNTNFADLLIALLDARKAGEERRDIRERSMRGKRAKVKSGRVIGLRAPYGYRHIRDEHGKVKTLKIDETTARIVRLIYKWYVQGDEQHKRLSLQVISKRLSQMGVKTPGETAGYIRKRKSGMWNDNTVRAILTNEVYAGVWRYGWLIGGTHKRRPLEETVTASVPAIVDREVWERAQTQREYNKAMSLRNTKRQYLLRGLIRCSCGYAMSACSKHPHRGYRCLSRTYLHSGLEDNPCLARGLRADAIEADVWDEIRELFEDLDRLWAELKAAQRNEQDALAPIREQLQITDDLYRQAEQDISDIAMAMRAARGRVIAEFEKQQDEANARLDSLTRKRDELIAQLGARRITDEAIETIMEYARRVRKGLDGATFDDKRRMLETLGVQVTVTQEKYHLKCILGEKDGLISQMKRGNVRIVPNSS